jgi:uncharacterized membrane protein
VADLKAGRKPDPKYGKIAKQRSTHNNYLTLPVLFLMLSNHYPLVFATPYNWVIASLVFLMGVTIRHWFNTRHARKGNPHWTWAVTVILFLVIAWLSTQPMRHAPQEATLEGEALQFATATGFDDVVDVVTGHCAMCHAAEPVWEGVYWPPKNVYMQAGISAAMPPAHLVPMDAQSRATIVAWFRAAGA